VESLVQRRRLRRVSLNLFIKWIEYIPSTFDIHDSIFDILFFRVSFSIKLAALPRRVNFSGRRQR